MIPVVFKRSKDAWPEKQQWRPAIIPHKKTATIACPECGMRGSLEGHRIYDNGTVHPSAQCTNCDWHAIIKLEGWSGT